MPTTPRRARLWLQARQACVVRREPFTIQLRFPTTAYTQPVTVGVDTGSQVVGVAAITNGEVVYQAEVHFKGAFVVKDVMSGKALVEVTPRKLVRLARPVQGWMITRLPSPQILAKEDGASSSV